MREHPLRQHLEHAVAQAARVPHAYTALHADDARLQLEHALAHVSVKRPLHGRVLAVKDLFDIAGQVTLAGSPLFGPRGLQHGPAQRDASAVAKLKQAGAIVLGRTNMSEFAFSGVGINPHCGTPINPCDPDTARVPGGSSSGSAVAVAAGAADIGLGTDTGGSLRIPAALCGIVGFKPTASSVDASGCFPLSKSLDSISVMTRSVGELIPAHQALLDAPLNLPNKPLSECRIGVARRFMTEHMDASVAHAWERSLDKLTQAGAQLVDWDSPLIEQAANLQTGRALVTIEAFALHRDWLSSHPSLYDPRVLARIRLGDLPEEAAHAVNAARHAWINEMAAELSPFDAMLAPTVPIVAPALADIAPGSARDDAFFKTNALLLRNTSVVNFLDGCAISLPCHIADELPVGLMLWQRSDHDAAILSLASQVEACLASPATHITS